MFLRRSALCALSLFVVLPVLGTSSAEAAFIRRGVIKQVTNSNGSVSNRVVVVSESGATAPASIEARVESDGGSEDVALDESDSWLHGAATLTSLPKSSAALTLTLYDKGSATLLSYSGTLGADGTVQLTADDTGKVAWDLEVLAGEVFPATGGYDLTLDLAGADTYEIAYAKVVVTETVTTTVCDKVKGCSSTTSTTSTGAEVGWEAVGAIWAGDLTLVHEGVVELKVTEYDSKGKKRQSDKSKLGMPWFDSGEGITALAVDEDPLTTVALHRRAYGSGKYGLELDNAKCEVVVSSAGWSVGDALPVSAQVELTGGDTITIPANSYQRLGRARSWMVNNFEVYPVFGLSSVLTITGGDFVATDSSVLELLTPVCAGGTCVSLVPNDSGDYELTVSEYGSVASGLADDLELTVTVTDDGGEAVEYAALVEFDDTLSVVFGNELTLKEDALGLDLAGKVSLLGEANKKGKQQTLAKGKFAGSFSRDGDGDLELAGADKDDVVSEGSIVTAGSALAFELTTDTNKDGVLNAPPVTPRLRGRRSEGAGRMTEYEEVALTY